MKLALFILLFSVGAWAKPLVLMSYFDPFGKAPTNSSEVVAKLFYEKMKANPEYDLRLCKLRTVFDKSFYEWEDCLKALPKTPDLLIGLGESNCNFKIEILGRNLDRTKGPDNDGIERFNTPIRAGGPEAIGFSYPLAQMYCSLKESDRKEVEVSNNAGSFVCNNFAYQVSDSYPELRFGFIHVPSHNCRNLEAKTDFSVNALVKMVSAGLATERKTRLPVTKRELKPLRERYSNFCEGEFYNRAKGIDEKKIWPF